MKPTPPFDRVLDCRGLLCPLPILRTSRALAGLEEGQVLRVVCTDRGSIADMAAFSRSTGNELLAQEAADGELVFFLRKAR